MTSTSTNALHNIDSPVGKEYNMVGVFQYVRILSFISFMFFSSLVPPSTARQANSTLDQSRGPDKLGVYNSIVFPVGQAVKKRKTPLVKYSACQSLKPIPVEATRLIRSVTSPRMFSYAVVQQPEDNPYYVSSSKNLVTEFDLAKKYGNIGLLAHNQRAGSVFKNFSVGQEIYVAYKDGQTERYIVSEIYRFRALEPNSIESRFIDLESRKIFTAAQVFSRMYTGAERLTFQTCILARGDPSWGRLFVIAVPAAETE